MGWVGVWGEAVGSSSGEGDGGKGGLRRTTGCCGWACLCMVLASASALFMVLHKEGGRAQPAVQAPFRSCPAAVSRGLSQLLGTDRLDNTYSVMC